MRYLFGFMCVLALGVMPMVGCGETAGTGGSGGDRGSAGMGGDGGSAGMGGDGGSAGEGGEGGSGGTDLCEGVDCDDGNECTEDVCSLALGVCVYTAVTDTECDFDGLPGRCKSGLCEGLCRRVDCDDANPCTDDACDAADGMCSHAAVEDDTSCGDNAETCQAGSCVGTFACTEAGIREAIAVGGGPHTFDCVGPTTVVTDAEIVIGNDVILDGRGELTVDGNTGDWVFRINGKNVVAELRGFGVTGHGSGIYNFGRLTLVDSTVFGTAGTGIFNQGWATLIASTVSGNSDGIRNIAPTLIDVGLALINSTVSGNGISSMGDPSFGAPANTTVVNSTVLGRISHGLAGGTRLTHSLVDGDCFVFDGPLGRIISNGYNIESPGDTCSFDQEGDQPNVTAERLNLGPLADNDGPTMTHKPGDGGLGTGSVAIDQIPEAACEVDTDQRGKPRPESGDTMCDVGSVEVQPEDP